MIWTQDNRMENTFRFNSRPIGDLKTFFEVRQGDPAGVKEVCFARALGEEPAYASRISEWECGLEVQIREERLRYKRIKKLPQFLKPEDPAYYAGVYDSILGRGGVVFRNFTMDRDTQERFLNAYQDTMSLFQSVKQNATATIIRNFGAKLLYWTDVCAAELLKGGAAHKFLKAAAENVEKEQEYLFFYLLTRFGCDVLLLQNRKDCEIPPKLLAESVSFTVGGFGNSDLPEYRSGGTAGYAARQVQAAGAPVMRPQTAGAAGLNRGNGSNAAGNTAPRPVVTIPPHPGRSSAQQMNVQASGNGTHLAAQNRQIASGEPTSAAVSREESAEKSFEELARLAASIVMISVHDKNGEVFAGGSGIMIGRDGYILTNFHVIEGGNYYTIRIEDDEQTYPTNEIIKYHTRMDLAILRIDRQLNPIPIYSGRKKLVRGQKVVAIGSPLGLFNSVSDGIISGFRKFEDGDMIQFTAPTSHGSSGGAVLNMQGEVIGISTAGIDRGQNLNLAVSYEDIRKFAGPFMK